MTEQLTLALDGAGHRADLALPARLTLPSATEAGAPFDDDGRIFEPWWPGAHAFVRRLGDTLQIQTEHLIDPLAAFPELVDLGAAIAADGVIVEGTLLALDGEGRPDPLLLRQRLAGSDIGGPLVEGAFVASDMPYLEGRSLARTPYAERRRALTSVLRPSRSCVLGPGLVGEGVTMAHAASGLGLAAISARRLDGLWKAGPAGDAWLRLPVSDVPDVPTRPFLVLLEKLPLDR